MSEPKYIIVFPSTHEALRAERRAKAEGFGVTMTVVPRRISSDCNMGMTASTRDRGMLEVLFAQEGVDAEFVSLD